MNRKLLLLTFLAFTLNIAWAQPPTYKQYFDGDDTLPDKTVPVYIDTAATNTWQIGRPQKIIFDSAATLPNALITDTVNTYPVNNLSRFTLGVSTRDPKRFGSLRIIAIRWKQKIDIDKKFDGGIVEYSHDTGKTWKNVFNNPDVYNFYGFDSLKNKDTLQNGKVAFSGTDSAWRDIWLCFAGTNLYGYDTFMLRFTLQSDSVDNNREGWMIDNLLTEQTYYHTVSETDPVKTALVYPTITSGIVKVEIGAESSYIDNVMVTDALGKVMKRNAIRDAKATLDISELPSGTYYLSIHTDSKIEVHKVILQQ